VENNKANYNIISFGKRFENLAISVKSQIIGSKLSTFEANVKSGSKIFLHCGSQIWGLATVIGNYQYNQSKVWSNDLYPHRYNIKVDLLTLQPLHLSNGIYNVQLREQFGSGWAYKFIFSPRPLPGDVGEKIEKDLRTAPTCDLETFLSAIKG
jgi:hypothetical protein